MTTRRGAVSSRLSWGQAQLGVLVVAALLILAGTNFASSPAEQAAPVGPSKYIGPGSCAASSCHGSIRPRNEVRIQQNEYSTWVTQDKHANAFNVLQNKVSQNIARILRLPKPAHESEKCLVCHSLYATPEQRGRPFDAKDGVSCESCHGPASGWLGAHTQKDAPHERNVSLGMYDTKDIVKRTEKCMTCHLGGIEPGKFVDHEMIAAGHPDLVFELDSFSAVMPRHWKEPYDKDGWRGARTWATGQAVQLREAMNRLIGRARGKVWPEYSELDCFACHHALTRPEESWRLTEDGYYKNRRVGDPAWNTSRFFIFRKLVHDVDANMGRQLDAEVNGLAAEMSKLSPDQEKVVATAGRVRDLSDGIARRLAGMNYDSAMALRWMKAIAGDADGIAMQGERVAEQATMAIDSIYVAYARNGGGANEREVRAAINGLFQVLENPSGYSAPRFAEQMQRVNATLR